MTPFREYLVITGLVFFTVLLTVEAIRAALR